jgi:hypothetical protein
MYYAVLLTFLPIALKIGKGIITSPPGKVR